MTYRERREAKAERLRGWAGAREAKAEAAHAASHPATAGIPFGQPILVGHHSERRHRAAVERGRNQADAMLDHARTATRHEEKAGNIERQLATSIYDDDPDALEALRAKLAGLEARRERIKAANAAYRKEHKAELKGLGAYEKDQRMPHAGYELRNLGGNITRARQRIARLESDAANGGPPDRVMTARYGSRCEDCAAEIGRGDTIRYSRANGARCAVCPTTEEG